jgi:hypothetical protein
MQQAEEELEQLKSLMPPDKWETLSGENYLRQRFQMYRVARDIVNRIILMRAKAVMSEKGLEKISMMYGYNKNGYVTCGWTQYGKQCKRRPADVTIWIPNLQDESEERKREQGDRGWIILLCLAHMQMFRKSPKEVTDFVRDYLSPLRKSQIMESQSA